PDARSDPDVRLRFRRTTDSDARPIPTHDRFQRSTPTRRTIPAFDSPFPTFDALPTTPTYAARRPTPTHDPDDYSTRYVHAQAKSSHKTSGGGESPACGPSHLEDGTDGLAGSFSVVSDGLDGLEGKGSQTDTGRGSLLSDGLHNCVAD
ncbi:hypothetical protein EW146_g10367, partial [Bondarzewia mesenterica]